MEFDVTTFVLEMANFLVLVWLLKHFFYQPVLAVIEARQAQSRKTVLDAEAVRDQALALQEDYRSRLAELEQMREAAENRLQEEISRERQRRLAELEREIGAQRERREDQESRRIEELRRTLERQAVTLGARFTTRLLDRLAGPGLESRLVELVLEDMESQATQDLDVLREALRKPDSVVKVVTAYPLAQKYRAAVTQALGHLAERNVMPAFSEDATLKAGMRVMVEPWVLMASLGDELGFFSGGIGRHA